MDLLLAAFRGESLSKSARAIDYSVTKINSFTQSTHSTVVSTEIKPILNLNPHSKTCFHLIVCSPNPTFRLPKVVLFPTLMQGWMQTRCSFQPDFSQIRVCQNLKWTTHSFTYQEVSQQSLVMQHCSKKEMAYQHLAVTYRVERGSDILHSVGELFDYFVGHKTVEKTRQNCKWVRYTNIITVRTE